MTDQPVPPLPRLILRIAIVVIAAFELYLLSDGYRLSFDTLAHPFDATWFNLLFSLGNGVIVPLCALAAAGLAIAGKRLGLAGILLCIAPLVYAIPVISFGIAIMIYGF